MIFHEVVSVYQLVKKSSLQFPAQLDSLAVAYQTGLGHVSVFALTEAMMCLFVCRDDDSDDEIDDQDIHKIMIVTQTPPPVKKHDRTGSYVTRVKMTQELSKAINDGLYYYEQVCK